MAEQGTTGTRFVVDLGDIQLPRVVEKQLEAEIQAKVLRALAEAEDSTSQRLPQNPFTRPNIWDNFPGRTLGLWIGDRDRPPTLAGSGEGQRSAESLEPRDHTLIVDAVMRNPVQVFQHLPERYKVRGARPPGSVVLEAALQVDDIDDYIKSLIRLVLELLPQLEEAQANASDAVKRSLDDLHQRLAGKSTGEKLRVLRSAGSGSRARHSAELRDGMETAAQILEDGEDSIYSTDHSFYQLLRTNTSHTSARERDTVDTIKDADTIGAAGGGLLGSFVPVLGTATGAAAGGGGASAGAAIGEFINWLFD